MGIRVKYDVGFGISDLKNIRYYIFCGKAGQFVERPKLDQDRSNQRQQLW